MKNIQKLKITKFIMFFSLIMKVKKIFHYYFLISTPYILKHIMFLRV